MSISALCRTVEVHGYLDENQTSPPSELSVRGIRTSWMLSPKSTVCQGRKERINRPNSDQSRNSANANANKMPLLIESPRGEASRKRMGPRSAHRKPGIQFKHGSSRTRTTCATRSQDRIRIQRPPKYNGCGLGRERRTHKYPESNPTERIGVGRGAQYS